MDPTVPISFSVGRYFPKLYHHAVMASVLLQILRFLVLEGLWHCLGAGCSRMSAATRTISSTGNCSVMSRNWLRFELPAVVLFPYKAYRVNKLLTATRVPDFFRNGRVRACVA